jgi:hypothetical protein
MVNSIVVAVDESEESMHACEWACKHLSLIETSEVTETTEIQQQQQSYNMILIHVQSTASSISAGPGKYIQIFIGICPFLHLF